MSIGWYNFACAAAVTGRRDEALRSLRQAVEHGFAYPDKISSDSDLASLRTSPEFAAIIAAAGQRAGK